jgi:hypothetical protein
LPLPRLASLFLFLSTTHLEDFSFVELGHQHLKRDVHDGVEQAWLGVGVFDTKEVAHGGDDKDATSTTMLVVVVAVLLLVLVLPRRCYCCCCSCCPSSTSSSCCRG